MAEPAQYDHGGCRGVFVDVWIDEPGENIDRPIPPERLERARKEREKLYGSPEPGPVPPEMLNKLLAQIDYVDVWFDETGENIDRPVSSELQEKLRKDREPKYGSPEPGPVPPEVFDKLGDFQPPPKDSDNTGNG